MTILDTAARRWDQTPKRIIVTIKLRLEHSPETARLIHEQQLLQSSVYDAVIEHLEHHPRKPWMVSAKDRRDSLLKWLTGERRTRPHWQGAIGLDDVDIRLRRRVVRLLVAMLLARPGLALEVKTERRLRLAPTATAALAPQDAPGEAPGGGALARQDPHDVAGVARQRSPAAGVPAAESVCLGARLAGRDVDHDPDLVPGRYAAAAPALASHDADGATGRGAIGDRAVEPDPQGRQPLDAEHGVAAVRSPGEPCVLHRHRTQLPPGTERRRGCARLGVSACEVVADAADQAPAEARGVELVGG